MVAIRISSACAFFSSTWGRAHGLGVRHTRIVPPCYRGCQQGEGAPQTGAPAWWLPKPGLLRSGRCLVPDRRRLALPDRDTREVGDTLGWCGLEPRTPFDRR